jgi:2-polyprenyl-3-methyl-5-hydroxy-6-metoxy-1,4-benzoquinol methylase
MLEVGCGRGEFLIGAARQGWKVRGVEMTKGFASAAISSGLEVECAPILDCKALDDEYDSLLMVAVLEHLYDPLQTLRRLWRSLRPGGLLFVEVPNELSLEMRLGNAYMKVRGRDWVVNLSPTFSPYHVVGWSRRSLTSALTMAGFQILAPPRHTRNKVLPRERGTVRRLELLGVRLSGHIGEILGMGDNVECWARRV